MVAGVLPKAWEFQILPVLRDALHDEATDKTAEGGRPGGFKNCCEGRSEGLEFSNDEPLRKDLLPR